MEAAANCSSCIIYQRLYNNQTELGFSCGPLYQCEYSFYYYPFLYTAIFKLFGGISWCIFLIVLVFRNLSKSARGILNYYINHSSMLTATYGKLNVIKKVHYVLENSKSSESFSVSVIYLVAVITRIVSFYTDPWGEEYYYYKKWIPVVLFRTFQVLNIFIIFKLPIRWKRVLSPGYSTFPCLSRTFHLTALICFILCTVLSLLNYEVVMNIIFSVLIIIFIIMGAFYSQKLISRIKETVFSSMKAATNVVISSAADDERDTVILNSLMKNVLRQVIFSTTSGIIIIVISFLLITPLSLSNPRNFLILAATIHAMEIFTAIVFAFVVFTPPEPERILKQRSVGALRTRVKLSIHPLESVPSTK